MTSPASSTSFARSQPRFDRENLIEGAAKSRALEDYVAELVDLKATQTPQQLAKSVIEALCNALPAELIEENLAALEAEAVKQAFIEFRKAASEYEVSLKGLSQLPLDQFKPNRSNTRKHADDFKAMAINFFTWPEELKDDAGVLNIQKLLAEQKAGTSTHVGFLPASTLTEQFLSQFRVEPGGFYGDASMEKALSQVLQNEASLKDENATSNQELSNKVIELADLRQDMVNLKHETSAQLKKSARMLSEQEREMDVLRGQASAARDEKAAMTIDIEELGETNRQLEGEVEKLEAKIEQLQHTPDGSDHVVAGVVDELKDKLSIANEKVDDLTQHLGETRDQLEVSQEASQRDQDTVIKFKEQEIEHLRKEQDAIIRTGRNFVIDIIQLASTGRSRIQTSLIDYLGKSRAPFISTDSIGPAPESTPLARRLVSGRYDNIDIIEAKSGATIELLGQVFTDTSPVSIAHDNIDKIVWVEGQVVDTLATVEMSGALRSEHDANIILLYMRVAKTMRTCEGLEFGIACWALANLCAACPLTPDDMQAFLADVFDAKDPKKLDRLARTSLAYLCSFTPILSITDVSDFDEVLTFDDQTSIVDVAESLFRSPCDGHRDTWSRESPWCFRLKSLSRVTCYLFRYRSEEVLFYFNNHTWSCSASKFVVMRADSDRALARWEALSLDFTWFRSEVSDFDKYMDVCYGEDIIKQVDKEIEENNATTKRILAKCSA